MNHSTAIAGAVVGTGFIGPVHVEALRRLGRPILGVVGSSPERGRQMAQKLNVPRAYDSLEALLADPAVSVVHLATPNHLHHAQCRQVLAAGKHVLCEKPLAMTSAETAGLVALAAGVPLACGVCYNVRYYPLNLEARQRIADGQIGPVYHVTGAYLQDWLLYDTDFNWRVMAGAGGALRAVADIGTHWLDLVQFVTGLEVESVCADLRAFLTVLEVHSSMNVILAVPEGEVVIAIAYSYGRFSCTKQKDGSSIRRQSEDTVAGESPESWCSRHNIPLDTSLTFRDLGRSAFRGKKQKELYAFLEYVKNGRIRPGSYLLIERVDRLTRKDLDEATELVKQILKAGSTIVTLANGRTYKPDCFKSLFKGGWFELQLQLEQAHEYSVALSGRVSAAWKFLRDNARENGTLVGGMLPPWLRSVGERNDRRAVVIPEKVETVRLLFDLAIAGHGTMRIVRMLDERGVPPLTGRKWARSTVRRLLNDRCVLGEFQPTVMTAEGRKPDGEPLPNHFPQVIDLQTFHKARACMSDRDQGRVCRDAPVFVNPFGGILVEAHTGSGYMANERVERSGKRHRVLTVSQVIHRNGRSFPYVVFEQAVLGLLAELDPRELLPQEDKGADRVLDLEGELAAVRLEIRDFKAEMQGRRLSRALNDRALELEDRERELLEQLAEARLQTASPAASTWAEVKSVLAAVQDADDPIAIRRQLRAVLRRLIDRMTLLVVPRHPVRLAAVQIDFREGGCRDYLIYHRPPVGNQTAKKKGDWRAASLAEALPVADLDLRNAADKAVLEADLLAVDLVALWETLA